MVTEPDFQCSKYKSTTWRQSFFIFFKKHISENHFSACYANLCGTIYIFLAPHSLTSLIYGPLSALLAEAEAQTRPEPVFTSAFKRKGRRTDPSDMLPAIPPPRSVNGAPRR